MTKLHSVLSQSVCSAAKFVVFIEVSETKIDGQIVLICSICIQEWKVAKTVSCFPRVGICCVFLTKNRGIK